MKRVVVTGMGVVTALGNSWPEFAAKLKTGTSAIRRLDDWATYKDLNTNLAGPIEGFVVPEHYPRKKIRSMGRVSLLSTRATEFALADAGLLDDPVVQSGAMGIAYGSSTGSTDATRDFAVMLDKRDIGGATATTYIRMMGHTAPVNIGVFFGMKGRIITTSSACTSGSQGIGYAYEAIKYGQQTLMVAGGAEELCPSEAAVFDTLYATSTKNDTPDITPSPFDIHRDGLVIGEGAGTLILEELEHAQARGAKIYAELVGFGTNSDGGHVTQPDPVTMNIAMQKALDDAGLMPADIGYINAHGTATDRGDIAESVATEKLFGKKTVPISTLKGNIGHTLGACGAIEAWASIQMMNDGWFAPTLNLKAPDPQCGDLDYIVGEGRRLDCTYIMSNNFAFGGINTSLIFKRWPA
ncbi:beta-ketoacyl-ACP synthase [Cellvibrio japonicus]|uniref:3-oxoacyl-(Acyl-carrier-protein) synthase II n=1 Tax=Cellvibrio japonicus (strain Ueda107) TaxID=498211 RepID=B3PFK1_CELJU|nr:beta-ketoacyl-ACP synthase [Cellvibrio japonicus]ACE82799.1 3-oxoacyl-(acyl-carrier-protein) synthase II [Cellvibrio japonicus Ueda107]QEI10866.1 beta-ketoacyl-ACP synthase [Cellvibrio japonicus]QEI14442.1 beta-ketoacyl-ACP synthase [Cellvibrio japonicus]QEI18020.1 beta-ketoacyl-ACP synthase [Cellvibrio japonicus]